MNTVAEWDRAWAAADLDVDVVPHPLLERELADRAPGRGLELGCGDGRPSVWLAQRGWAMTAVDFSPVAVDRLARIAAAHEVIVDAQVADVVRYRPAPPLDLVLVAYLHVPGLDDVLRRAAAGLAPGGSLVILGWHAASPVGPPHRYDPDLLTATLADLEVVRAEQVAADGDASDLLMHLVRARASGTPPVTPAPPPCRPPG